VVIGWGRAGKSADRRALAMGACLALLLAEPALLGALQGLSLWFTGEVGALTWMPRVTPVAMLWALAAPPGYFELGPWRAQVLTLLVAAGLGWLSLMLGLRRRGPRLKP
jgi:hypothetical protein